MIILLLILATPSSYTRKKLARQMSFFFEEDVRVSKNFEVYCVAANKNNVILFFYFPQLTASKNINLDDVLTVEKVM